MCFYHLVHWGWFFAAGQVLCYLLGLLMIQRRRLPPTNDLTEGLDIDVGYNLIGQMS